MADEARSQLTCLFCSHRHLTISDRYSWGVSGRAEIKAMLKKAAYSDADNLFIKAFGDYCITLLDMIKHQAEVKAEEAEELGEEPDFDLMHEINWVIEHIEHIEAALLEHGAEKEKKAILEGGEYPDLDDTFEPIAVRVCALCWDRAIAAPNGKVLFKLFR